MSDSQPTLPPTVSFLDLDDATRLPPLASRYELIEPIARGGVAWVWRAHDLTLDRPVAVKMLRADADPRVAARFAGEGQAAARVKHPSVVAVYDAGIHDGLPFLAMELVEGETLRERLNRDGRFEPEAVRRIGRALAGALDAIRRAGLVHGDVKPENVIVRPDGEVTLTDLGLARAVWEQGADEDTAVWGTPGYIAPERLRGEAGDHRSDVYSLGVLLFECATGSPAPTEGEIPWTSLIAPDVPEELSAAIARATLANPAERYPTAAALALQLASDPAAGPSSVTRAIEASERATVALQPTIDRRAAAARKSKRHRMRLFGVAGLAVAILAGFLAFQGGGKVDVPSVQGQVQADAEQILTDAGLETGTAFAYASQPAGIVIGQDPEPGTQIRSGDAVTITVSLGPRIVRVPKVKGLQPDIAFERLEEAGFIDIRQRKVFSDVEIGLVARTDPSGNELAEGDAPIFIEISKGFEQIKVPSVKNLDREEARQALADAGFNVTIETQEHRVIAEGLAIGTRPVEGTKIRRGSDVTLVVSSGVPTVEVPNLSCLKRQEAEKQLGSIGLRASFEGGGKRVVDQDPPPGSRIPESSTVTLLLGLGAFC